MFITIIQLLFFYCWSNVVKRFFFKFQSLKIQSHRKEMIAVKHDQKVVKQIRFSFEGGHK